MLINGGFVILVEFAAFPCLLAPRHFAWFSSLFAAFPSLTEGSLTMRRLKAGFIVVTPLLLLLSVCDTVTATFLPSGICLKNDIQESLLLRDNQCVRDGDGSLLSIVWTSRVREINGTTLGRALKMLQTKDSAYAAVLFYANWCPFSRKLRSLLDTLSSTFPTIYHIAVEDSAIQPSALSQHGVHSFPVLFLHNKTLQVRYHGPRTMEAVAKFYEHMTGMKTTSLSRRGARLELIEELSTEGLITGKPNCPYPWAKSPEKWLHDDLYLLLSTAFLVLRVLVYLMPKLLRRLKDFWVRRERSLLAHKAMLRKVLLRDQDAAVASSTTKSKVDSERQRKGKGVLPVPAWPAPPLAVAIAEGSSSRSTGCEDGCENGHSSKIHFWG